VNCSALLQEVAAAERHGADAKQIGFLVEFPVRPVMIRTDARALKQILLNLTNNAIKFTARGGVTVRLRESRTSVEFSVTDTGPGIRAEDRLKLFEPFSQVGTPGGGTGLGLYLSRKLVELLGARIDLESHPGSGSTFRLTLGRN
jgi:protein-histidine pros-kinase